MDLLNHRRQTDPSLVLTSGLVLVSTCRENANTCVCVQPCSSRLENSEEQALVRLPLPLTV